MDNRFTDIIQLIKQSRTNAIRAVNAERSTKIRTAQCIAGRWFGQTKKAAALVLNIYL